MSARICQGLLYILASASAAGAAVVQRRGEIAYDSVVGFPKTVPDGIGAVYQKFQPYLQVDTDCAPFPAVDASGNTNSGLSHNDDQHDSCSSSPGQVYVRSAALNSSYALMYSWYFPKDSPLPGLGHRHEWEGVVVWIDDPEAAQPQLLGVAASAHGKYQTHRSPSLQESRPLIRYFNVFLVNHQMGFTSRRGDEQPLVAWESLPEAARDALQSADFGDATVPFKDGSFEKNLREAALTADNRCEVEDDIPLCLSL
ncbi:hypothetical protein GTA08_BOTSDO09273 [Neofusicoccum parvum]|nr:hypothetical protein GTA08_BOTSDO09273 [Neofusicoccum parvum]